MKALCIKNGLQLRNVPPALVDLLDDHLTFKNPQYEAVMKFSPWEKTNVPEYVNLLRRDEKGHLYLPRAFDFSVLPMKWVRRIQGLPIKDLRNFVPAVFPENKVHPNDQQKEMLKALQLSLKKNTRPFGNYLFLASTSTGKTIGQALAAKALGGKTLVLCKTNLIKRAWEQDLELLFGITKKELGIIQQKKFKIGDVFTLSSLATLNRRRHLWRDIFKEFGTVILDECHTLPSNQIYEFVTACPCRNVVGATATLHKRSDGKEFMTKLVFGKALVKIDALETETASSMPITDATQIVTNYFNPMGHDDFDYHALLESVCADDARNQQIVEEVKKDLQKKNNVVLVTSSRVAHVQLLAAMIEEEGVKVHILTGSENTRKNSSDLINDLMSRKVRVLCATDQVICTGANINTLNRLHIAVPIKDKVRLEQLLGRIRRKAQGKIDSKVRYYCDSRTPYFYNIFKRQAVPLFQKNEIKRWQNVYLA